MTEDEYDIAMKPFRDRFQWDKDHFFDRKSYNPFVAAGEGDAKPKNRTGFQDYFHALKNLYVESRRIKKAAA